MEKVEIDISKIHEVGEILDNANRDCFNGRGEAMDRSKEGLMLHVKDTERELINARIKFLTIEKICYTLGISEYLVLKNDGSSGPYTRKFEG